MLDLKSVRNFAEEINSRENKVDILVNNAGISIGTAAKVLLDSQYHEILCNSIHRLNLDLKTCQLMVWSV